MALSQPACPSAAGSLSNRLIRKRLSHRRLRIDRPLHAFVRLWNGASNGACRVQQRQRWPGDSDAAYFGITASKRVTRASSAGADAKLLTAHAPRSAPAKGFSQMVRCNPCPPTFFTTPPVRFKVQPCPRGDAGAGDAGAANAAGPSLLACATLWPNPPSAPNPPNALHL